ncbi:hypothetical protein ANO14919_135510 [Xylariales sp. No.14919]|nr:hypothetical protein ANO14919_135510 [Xylariales sp. No.14919]
MQKAASPRPVCANCQGRKEPCDYSSLHGAAATRPGAAEGPRESSEPESPAQSYIREIYTVSRPPPRAPSDELRHIVRWFDATCEPRTMFPAARVDAFEFKPQYARNPLVFQYLVPYITAVGSLHALRQDRARAPALLPAAYAANVAASRAFRATERDVVDATNWPPILLFTLCNLMFYFAASQSAAPAAFDHLEIFQRVLRGSGGLRRALLAQLSRAGFVRQAWGGAAAASSSSHSIEAQAALARLAGAAHPDGTPDATVAACAEALELLRKWTVAVDGRPRNWAHVFYWPCAVSQAFVLALGARQPVATLIFVHWCAVMHRAPQTWFLDGWARRTAFAAVAAMPSAADYDFLRWPVAVFDPGLEPGVCIAFEKTGNVGT